MGRARSRLRARNARVADGLRELKQAFSGLKARSRTVDETAGYELAGSAHRFTTDARKVVDDKLSFSAALMRAGEADAARRLLAEVEDDVVTQEAALIERMNEVRLSGARQREQITRLRTLRTLAVCALGAGLLMCSAFGIAVAGFLERRAREDRADPRIHSVAVPTPRASGEGPSGAAPAPAADRASRLVRLTVGGVSLRLTPDQYVLYRRITSGPIDQGRLQAFLLQLLPAQEVAAFERALLASREDPFAEVAASHRGALLAVERHLRRAREGAAQRPAEDVEAAEGEEDEGSTAASEPQEQGEPPQSDEDALDPIEDGEEPPDDQGDAPPPAPEQGGPDSPSPPPESPSPDPGGPESSSPLPGAPDSPEGAPSLGD